LKKLSVVISVISLCGLCLLVNIATVKASYLDYSHTTYTLQNPVTLDGKWTTTTEWTDGGDTHFGNTSNAVFRSKWEMVSDGSAFSVYQYIIVEILNDNTNDTGDYWQFCFDGDESGGTAPQAGDITSDTMDIRIDILSHSNLTEYYGTGTGWSPVSAPSTFQWKDAINSSPTSSTPHWILEVKIDKINFGIAANYWLRVAYYDASRAAAGVQAWPPTSRDVPNNWGDIPYSSDVIPENLSVGVAVLLSSVAVFVGSFGFRKKRINRLATSCLR
jgi:hypothetical protein